MISYKETDEYKKDFKKLLKRFGTLVDDLETAKTNALELLHEKNIDNRSSVQITGLNSDKSIYKLRKFACKSLKGSGVMSGIRIIYEFNTAASEITFIEIYYKGDKENEDRDRIKKYIDNVQK